jgi:hypothetical protein
MNIASEIKKLGFTDGLKAADSICENKDQNYENETTTFYFKDGSKLEFCSIDYSVE